MRISVKILAIVMALATTSSGQGPTPSKDAPGTVISPLEARVAHFDVADAIVRDAISELSLKEVDGLHLGFEEVIRENIQDDPRALSVNFSLHLENSSVRQILDAICEADRRYTWSEDVNSVNIYPRTVKNDGSYLLDLRIDRIALTGAPDPDQALTPLSRLFPQQQVGYFGGGGEIAYAEPWSAALEHLTVRQFINRIAEQMGSRTSWIWQGGKKERMFTFFRGGFHTFRPNADPR
jgi:hypothetical protein